MAKPLCIDLFCGLGGWANGFLAEGYDVIGFDIERHAYGDDKYPGQLVLQDVRTLHGSQFKKAAVIVASPPCQAYSYRAQPWGALWLEHNRMDDDGGPAGNYQGKDPISNELFRACFRIAEEAGLPIVIENVKGAQKFMGTARWHSGSMYLWGDVPALMPQYAVQKGKCGSWFGDKGNRRLYVPPEAAAEIRALSLAPGQPFIITKVQSERSRSFNWVIERKHEHGPAAAHADPIRQFSQIEQALKTAIAAACAAEKFGAEIGYPVKFSQESIKSLACTVMIGMGKAA